MARGLGWARRGLQNLRFRVRFPLAPPYQADNTRRWGADANVVLEEELYEIECKATKVRLPFWQTRTGVLVNHLRGEADRANRSKHDMSLRIKEQSEIISFLKRDIKKYIEENRNKGS